MSRLSGDKWRKMRALTSPAFKSSMLKRAFPIIEKCTDEFLEIMEEKVTPEQECVQIDQPFFRLSMEILLRYNVGARLNLQAASRETEPFVNSVRESLRRSPFKWIMIFNAIPLWYSIKRLTVFVRECFHVPATTRVHQHVAELVRLRRAEGQKSPAAARRCFYLRRRRVDGAGVNRSAAAWRGRERGGEVGDG
ncbi:putative cytochrome P450 [Ixodes scapularis]